MAQETIKQQWISVQSPAMGGWNTLEDASAIKDNEAVDIDNMTYENGYISPRQGSRKLYDKPSGENGNELQLITARTSDKLEYLIAIYGNSFYLRHPTTDDWVKINQTWAPTQTNLYYGDVSWNNGRGDDRLYVCNGVDTFARWDICVDTVQGATTAGATTLTLNDGTRFPAGGGTLLLKKSSDGTTFKQAYSSRTGSVFTLTALLFDVDDGSFATLDMIEKSAMPLGKHLTKWAQRLIVANYYGGETVIKYSVQNSAEDFTEATTIAGAGSESISDGNGEITGVHDFGAFLLIMKTDSVHSFSFEVDSTLGSKLANIRPILSGQSIGALDSSNTVKVLNSLFYPTDTNGFIKITPQTTSYNTSNISIETKLLSRKIDSYLRKNINLQTAKVTANDNQIFWAVSRIGAEQNTLVLVYDVLRGLWKRYSGWGVRDFTAKDNKVIYLEIGSGNIYETHTGAYDDEQNEYMSSALLKRFDYGAIGELKNQTVIYLQGYMQDSAEFYVDVYMNEDGILKSTTFMINKDTDGLYFSSPLTDENGAFILGQPIMDMVTLPNVSSLSFFRGYLKIPEEYGFYTIQTRLYGTRASFWGITGISGDPQIIEAIPQDFLINAT